MNGFRNSPAPSRKEKVRELETQVKNMETALRINQMMTRQLLDNNKNMTDDLGRALGLINELQYKCLAMQKAANLDAAQMQTIANELRLVDFSEASDREDADQGFTVGDIVKEDSTIILTSTTDAPDRGIFRSRIKLADCGKKEMIEAFMGREVGAKAIVDLNGVEHTIEILGIRQPPVVQEVVAETAPQLVN